MIEEKEIKVFRIVCDVCKKQFEYSDEYGPWSEDIDEWWDDAEEYGNWKESEDGNEHYCHDHWKWDEDKVIRVDE